MQKKSLISFFKYHKNLSLKKIKNDTWEARFDALLQFRHVLTSQLTMID